MVYWSELSCYEHTGLSLCQTVTACDDDVQERVLGRIPSELRRLSWPGGVRTTAACQGCRHQQEGHERKHSSTHGRYTRRGGLQRHFLSFLPRCMQCRRGPAVIILSVHPSVCLSVCQTRGLWQNGRTICPGCYTVRKIIQSSFLKGMKKCSDLKCVQKPT